MLIIFQIQGLKRSKYHFLISLDPAILFLDICIPVRKNTCTKMLIAALFELERKIIWK
jgi:hypothetical protein